jgi:hypothetical protein
MSEKYSKELLESVVKNSVSVAEVLRKLDIKQSGGNHSHISSRIKKYGLDVSHFQKFSIDFRGGRNKLSNEKVLVNDRLNGRRDSSKRLRNALLESGIEYKCAVCRLPPLWNNKPLQLQIDHINGIGTDNNIKNIRFICGNCHIQTDNFGSKNTASFINKKSIVKIQKVKAVKQSKPAEINPDWRHQPKINTRKVIRPSKEELQKLLWEKPTSKLAIDFGVSDNAINKWAKSYGLNKPPRGYWAKLYSQTDNYGAKNI